MRFLMKDVDPDSRELRMFRDSWQSATQRENALLNGEEDDGGLSDAQRLAIDLFCGFDADWRTVNEDEDAPTIIRGERSAQVELEAVLRARNRALTAMFARQFQQGDGA